MQAHVRTEGGPIGNLGALPDLQGKVADPSIGIDRVSLCIRTIGNTVRLKGRTIRIAW